MPPTGSSCRQCRARKVKCDRTPVRCLACIRLELDCSLGSSSDAGSVALRDDLAGAEELTQAGTKRKRTRRACVACRVVKAKCLGGHPCQRCIGRHLSCEGITNHAIVNLNVDANQASSTGIGTGTGAGTGTDSNVDFERTPGARSTFSNASHLDLGHNILSASTSSPSTTPDKLDRATTRSYLEAYFEQASRYPLSVLHKATVLGDWSQGNLDRDLLKIILATVQYQRDGHPGGTAAVRQAMHQVQQDALANWCRYSLTQLQVLVLLARLRFQAGDNVDVWNLLPLAARIIFTLRLNHEQDVTTVSQHHPQPQPQPPDAVHQECRRRLVWAVFQFDRLYAGGFEDLAVCPPDKIHLRLPCDEHTFRRGAGSRAGFLLDRQVHDSTAVDIFAFLLRLSVIRDRILRYTKRLRRTGSLPADHDLQTLQAELDQFELSLPVDLKLSAERLKLMAHSPESVKYMALHTQWHQSHCDLYRICVPGLRESLPRDVVAQTPGEIIARCQQNCLWATLRLCGLWSDMYRLEPSDMANDAFLSISIYFAAQTVRHLRHLLPAEGPNTLSMVKERLQDALCLARPLEIMPRPAKCLKDAEKVIRALEEGTLEQSSRASSVGADVSKHYLPSKHTLFPRFVRGNEDESEPTPSSLRTRGSGSAIQDLGDSITTTDEQEPAARIMLDLAGENKKQQQQQQQQLSTGDSEFDRGLAAWDPFDTRMTGYYDSDLCDLLASFEQQCDSGSGPM